MGFLGSFLGHGHGPGQIAYSNALLRACKAPLARAACSPVDSRPHSARPRDHASSPPAVVFVEQSEQFRIRSRSDPAAAEFEPLRHTPQVAKLMLNGQGNGRKQDNDTRQQRADHRTVGVRE
jgi:hypothetical protein